MAGTIPSRGAAALKTADPATTMLRDRAESVSVGKLMRRGITVCTS